MSEPTDALVVGTTGRIGCEIKNDIVRTCRIPADCEKSSEMIQLEKVPQTPGDKVIGAGRIAAQADPTDKFLSRTIKPQAAAENVNSADLLSHKGIVASAEIRRRPLVGGRDI